MKRARGPDDLAVIPHEVTTLGESTREPGIDVSSSFHEADDFMRSCVPYQSALKALMQHVFEDWEVLWNGKSSLFFSEPHIRAEIRQFLTQAYQYLKALGAVVIYVYRDPSQWIRESIEAFAHGDTRAGSTDRQRYGTLPFGVVDPTLGTFRLRRRARAPTPEIVFEVNPSEDLGTTKYDFRALVHDVRLRDRNGARTSKLHSSIWHFIRRQEEIERLRNDRNITSHQLARPPITVTARPENPEDPANMDVSRIYQDDAMDNLGGHSDGLYQTSKRDLLERLGQVQRGIQIHPQAVSALDQLPDEMLDVAPTARMIWVDSEHEANVTQRPVFQIDLSEQEVALEREICRFIGLPWIFYSGSVGTQRKGDSAKTGYSREHTRIWRQELKATVQDAREIIKEVFAWAYAQTFADYDASLREERDREIIALEERAIALSKAPGKGQRLKKEERRERGRELWNTLMLLEARTKQAAEPTEGGRITFYTTHAFELDEITELKTYAGEGYFKGAAIAELLNTFLESRMGELPKGMRARAPPVEPYEQQREQMQQQQQQATPASGAETKEKTTTKKADGNEEATKEQKEKKKETKPEDKEKKKD